jgi:hypothetical protein
MKNGEMRLISHQKRGRVDFEGKMSNEFLMPVTDSVDEIERSSDVY